MVKLAESQQSTTISQTQPGDDVNGLRKQVTSAMTQLGLT